MPGYAHGLGADYDISAAVAPADLSAAASTGKRIDMSQLRSVDVVLFKGAGTAGDDPVLTLEAADAAAGGTVANLATVTGWHVKGAATLAGTETWSSSSQAAAATVTDTGGAASQQILVVHVRAGDMPPGKPYLGVNVNKVGINAQLGAVLYIAHVSIREDPALLPAALR